MKTVNNSTAGRWAGILVCLLACCVSGAGADEYYAGGVTIDIDRDVLGYLWVADATVNLHENAWVKNVYNAKGQLVSAGDVWAESGSVLNIYGGKIDSLMIVTSSYNGLPEANVTVYGSAFAVNGIPVVPGTPEVFLQGETLSGVYENGTAFAYNVECFWEGNFYLTVKLGWIVGTPEISVTPQAVEFGDVEIGTEQTGRVTVTNTGNANLSLQSLAVVQADGAGFGFMPLDQLPLTVEPNSVVEIEVVFTPSAEGAANAILQIGSDDPEHPLVEVLLSGAGFEPVLTPGEQIALINAFYAQGLQDGTIAGVGPGKSGKAKAVALGQMLVCARALIDGGYQRWALIPLSSVENKTDGQARPADFVTGSSVGDLNAMINNLITDIKDEGGKTAQHHRGFWFARNNCWKK